MLRIELIEERERRLLPVRRDGRELAIESAERDRRCARLGGLEVSKKPARCVCPLTRWGRFRKATSWLLPPSAVRYPPVGSPGALIPRPRRQNPSSRAENGSAAPSKCRPVAVTLFSQLYDTGIADEIAARMRSAKHRPPRRWSAPSVHVSSTSLTESLGPAGSRGVPDALAAESSGFFGSTP